MGESDVQKEKAEQESGERTRSAAALGIAHEKHVSVCNRAFTFTQLQAKPTALSNQTNTHALPFFLLHLCESIYRRTPPPPPPPPPQAATCALTNPFSHAHRRSKQLRQALMQPCNHAHNVEHASHQMESQAQHAAPMRIHPHLHQISRYCASLNHHIDKPDEHAKNASFLWNNKEMRGSRQEHTTQAWSVLVSTRSRRELCYSSSCSYMGYHSPAMHARIVCLYRQKCTHRESSPGHKHGRLV